jgi:hypothetical protein
MKQFMVELAETLFPENRGKFGNIISSGRKAISHMEEMNIYLLTHSNGTAQMFAYFSISFGVSTEASVISQSQILLYDV